MSRKLIRARESKESEYKRCALSAAVYDSLKQYCLFLTRDKWDAEDLVQETAFKALKHAGRYTELSQPLMKKIAYHLWIDHVRKQGREMLSDRTEAEETSDMSAKMPDETVEMLMTKLTPKQLVIFTLKEGFQYKISEISELTEMSETAVKGVLSRSRANLKRTADNDHKGRTDIDIYWPEQLMDVVSPAVRHSLAVQDPFRLIRLIPLVITQSSGLKLIFTGKMPCSSLQSPLVTAA